MRKRKREGKRTANTEKQRACDMRRARRLEKEKEGEGVLWDI